MSAFEGAPCVGRSWLWDSTEIADHQEAAAECATCPAFDQCHALLLQMQTDIGQAMRAAGGGPTGTWAGELVGKNERRAQCGTDSGYFRHRRNNEAPCGDCREAHSRVESERYSRRRARMQVAS